MVLNQLGNSTGPRTVTKKRQKVFMYDEEKYFAFILDSGVMYKAGKNNSFGGAWPEKVDSRKLSPKGIGLNIPIYKAVMKTEGEYTFYVYDKKKKQFYRLTDYSMLAQNAKPEKYFSPPLVLTPLQAYEVVKDESKLDPNLRRIKSR